MDSIDKINKRMDVQQICAFLLNGAESFAIETDDLKERLKNGSYSIITRLENIYHDDVEKDDALSDLSKALTVYEQVYTEIGMKFGVKLIFQLLHE